MIVALFVVGIVLTFAAIIAEVLPPPGYVLMRADDSVHNKIIGGTFPRTAIVIVQDGRVFVRTRTKDSDRFRVYREGFETYRYGSQGE